MSRSADYDHPRRDPADEPDEDSLRLLSGRGRPSRADTIDDDDDPDAALGLLAADLASFFTETERTAVVPVQADEFVCHRCFLVFHRSRAAGTRYGRPVCRDCA